MSETYGIKGCIGPHISNVKGVVGSPKQVYIEDLFFLVSITSVRLYVVKRYSPSPSFNTILYLNDLYVN